MTDPTQEQRARWLEKFRDVSFATSQSKDPEAIVVTDDDTIVALCATIAAEAVVQEDPSLLPHNDKLPDIGIPLHNVMVRLKNGDRAKPQPIIEQPVDSAQYHRVESDVIDEKLDRIVKALEDRKP